MTDEIRDADGCEDFESLDESGLHDDEQVSPDTPGTEPAEVTEEAQNADEEAAEPEEEPETEEIDPAEVKLQEANDKYMRLFAEFDNYRKRTAKEKSETYQDAVAKTLLALLPAVDSFERAMEAPCADEAYRSGMEKIYAQMTDLLKKLGLEEIPALNEPFDPKVHNAIRQIEDENFGESTVCEVYQKGYRLGDRIVRCAMVSVAN